MRPWCNRHAVRLSLLVSLLSLASNVATAVGVSYPLKQSANGRYLVDRNGGAYVAVAGSPFANSGSRSFTPPGSNGAGADDWVLVLEATPPGKPRLVTVRRTAHGPDTLSRPPTPR